MEYFFSMVLNIAGINIKVENQTRNPKALRTEYLDHIAKVFKAPKNTAIDYHVSLVDYPASIISHSSVDGRLHRSQPRAPISIDYQTREIIIGMHQGQQKSDELLMFYLRYFFTILIAEKGGLLLHSSAVKIDNSVYVFIGKSGSGKTTIASLLSGIGTILNDETNAIIYSSSGWQAISVPFTKVSSIWLCSAVSGPVAGIYLLKKAPENFFHPLPASKNFTPIVASIISNSEMPEPVAREWLGLCGLLSKSIIFGQLEFINNSSISDFFNKHHTELRNHEIFT
jgi:hypothetical protein